MISWFSQVPAGWGTVRVKHIAKRVTDGAHISPDQDGGEYPFVSTRDLSNGHIDFDSALRTSPETYAYMVRTGCQPLPGDILFSKDGTVGETALVPGGHYFVVASSLVIISPDLAKSDPKYVRYALASRPAVEQAASFKRGTGLPRLSVGNLARLELPAPSVPEQRAIAAFLDRETVRIDTLIAEQQRLIELLLERRAAVIESKVAVRPSGGIGQRLKHVVVEVRQGWSPQCYPWPADGVNAWAVLKAGATNGGVFRSSENKELPDTEVPRLDTIVKRGQLVVSRANTRELAGSAAVVDGNYPRLMLSDKLYGFSLDPDRAKPEYVASVMSTRRWRGMIELEATGSSPSMQNISQADILNLPMDLPDIGEQNSIVNQLTEQTEKINSLIGEAEKFIELSRERRSALITAAVTGQIDVSQAA